MLQERQWLSFKVLLVFMYEPADWVSAMVVAKNEEVFDILAQRVHCRSSPFASG